jgi:hypothetical protein
LRHGPSQVSSVGVVTELIYRMDDCGIEVPFCERVGVCLLHSVHADPGVHTVAGLKRSEWGLFLRVQRPGFKSHLSSPSKNAWLCTFTPLAASVTGWLRFVA